MRTTDSHSYHGITLRNDAYGWTIQLKLLGKYRQLRTYATSAEEAARRHDVALSRLEAFVETSTQPNFPDDFASIGTSRSDFKSEDGGRAFFDELLGLFSSLCKEAELAGLDPQDLAAHKRQAAEHKRSQHEMKHKFARLNFSVQLLKLRELVPSCHLSADKSKQVSDMLEQTQRIFELAS